MMSVVVKSVDLPERLNLNVTGPVAVSPERRGGPAAPLLASAEAVMTTVGASVTSPRDIEIQRNFLRVSAPPNLE